ncbi:MAG TPA: GNAT family N-acetyltransferase [Actinoplanes sp.]
MTWHLSGSVEEFADAAGEFLRSRPVEHTVPLTLVDSLRRDGPHVFGSGDPLFGWYRTTDGPVAGACLQTPPFPLLITAAPDLAALARLLADRPLPGVNALAGDVDEFVAAWRQLTGATVVPGRRSRLFRLDALTPPSPPAPGAPRVAGPADHELLIMWMNGFYRDVGEGVRDVAGFVDEKLRYGGLTLWEVDGVPVSMAGASRPQSGMVRVQAVYTPPEHRRRGYAGAVTTVVSQAALDAGAVDVVLFTDLANPTSNALYQRLGYRPVEDRTVVEFR